MPANKNAVTRYFILDKLLANRYHHYSTEDLLRLVNEQLAEMDQEPVSRRTIELDLNYLQEAPFYADIESYQIDDISQRTLKTIKKSCHRYADPSYSIFKKEMTEDEKYLLHEALSLLGQFDGLPNLEGLERLRKGLNVKTDRQIVSFTKNPLENSNMLGELFTRIAQRQVVELHYHRFDAPDEDRKTVVHPYLLKEYNQQTGATILISSHNLQHTVDICPRIALMEHGHIIRDLRNEHNSAEAELEAYFDARIEEEQPLATEETEATAGQPVQNESEEQA